MGSCHIRVSESGFLTARGRYISAISEMESLSNDQQAFLNELAGDWRGNGAVAFRTAISDVSRQTKMGMFMIHSIQNQAGSAHRVFKEADADIARSFIGPQKR